MIPTPVETNEQIDHTASVWAVKERPLSPADEAALREWLSGDPRRRGALLRAEAAWLSLSRAKALGPPTEWQGAKGVLSRLPSRRRFLKAAGLAGGLVAASVLVVAGLQSDEAATRMGEIRRLPMNDGSIATLNTQSRLRIDLNDRERRIEIVKGEAWFKVAKNKARPFVVTAGHVRVKAVGTAFSVKKQANGAEIFVTEGTVMAWTTQSNRSPVRLGAGDRALVSDKHQIAVQHAPDVIDGALAWREGQIALDGKSLFEVAAELNRYNRTKIIIQDTQLGREKLIGRLSANDPEAFSSAVAQAFSAEVVHEDEVIKIQIKK